MSERKLVVFLDNINPKLMKFLMEEFEKENIKSYIEDEEGNILPFTEKDFKERWNLK